MEVRIYSQTENNKDLLDRDASKFMTDFMTSDSSRVLDQNTYDTLNQLKEGAFWRVLSNIDKDEDRRRITEDTFKPDEIVGLLSICMNQAIIFPRAKSWPGDLMGNTIVYRYFEDQNSLVRLNTINIPGFEGTLQNGRFWESLATMRENGESSVPHRARGGAREAGSET